METLNSESFLMPTELSRYFAELSTHKATAKWKGGSRLMTSIALHLKALKNLQNGTMKKDRTEALILIF